MYLICISQGRVHQMAMYLIYIRQARTHQMIIYDKIITRLSEILLKVMILLIHLEYFSNQLAGLPVPYCKP
jgi:hypothetical protein